MCSLTGITLLKARGSCSLNFELWVWTGGIVIRIKEINGGRKIKVAFKKFIITQKGILTNLLE